MKRLRPIFSVLLALLVLISGTSFMVGVHHCGGHVASVALFTKAEPCPMETRVPPCHKPMKSCCSDESIVHDSEDFKPAAGSIQLAPAAIVAAFASPVVIATLIPETITIDHPAIDTSPPSPPDINVVTGKFQI